VISALERDGLGFDVGGMRVPIVPSAVIFDLKLGDGRVRPDAAMGQKAVENAFSGPVAQGCVGAGTGASVGKILGVECATKGGLGSAGARFADGLAVGALAVVNAFGDVRDPATGRLLAGARTGPDSHQFVDTWRLVATGSLPESFGEKVAPAPGAAPPCAPAPGAASPGAPGSGSPPEPQNTTLGVVVASAALSPLEMDLVARLAGDAFARVLSPGGTRYDGDLVIALAAGRPDDERLPVPEPHRVGLLAREALEAALLRAVREAEPLGGLLASRDLVAGEDL
jgi:L-aminopeptidase/D-esterase-like protein